MKDNELYTRCAAGDKAARDALIQSNIGLIHMVVNRFKGRSLEEDDMFQLAAIGLLKAADGFDTTRGNSFSTYAVPMMMGEILRVLRDDGPIKVSRSYKQSATKAAQARRMLTEQTGREPTLSEIAEVLKMPTEELSLALSAVTPPASLDEPLGDGDTTLRDTVRSEDNADSLVTQITLQNIIHTLPKRERGILYLRYIKEETQARVAARFGISQVQISRLEKKILLKLRGAWAPPRCACALGRAGQ